MWAIRWISPTGVEGGLVKAMNAALALKWIRIGFDHPGWTYWLEKVES